MRTILALLLLALPLAASPEREAALRRFSDARMGLFIHWVQWGTNEGRDDCWGLLRKNHPQAAYKEAIRSWRGEKFDARAIVAFAWASGANYITFVAKHHDGFCLWDSRFTDFDSMDFPMRRDYLRELADACHADRMPLIIYYSLGLDWTHPDFLTRKQYLFARPSNPESNASAATWTPARFENYRKFCIDQLEELATRYAPVAGFWFDPLGAELANPDLFKVGEIYQHIRKLSPGTLIFNKTGITGTEDILVGERELASISMHYGGKDAQSERIRKLADAAWLQNRFKKAEIAVTSQGTWAWNAAARCLPAENLHAMLKGAADNNANLLLNFGPLPDGSIPEDVDREFRALGRRIKAEGFPPLNTATWKQKRLGDGEKLDNRESDATAR